MSTDIIEAIDELFDEPIGRVGEYEIAYLQGDYERCPHCNRHWHGLPLTERVAHMYARGQYDPEYLTAEDDSAVLCDGSTFIGPRRPTQWENAATSHHSWTIEGGRSQRNVGTFSLRVQVDTEAIDRWRAQCRSFAEAMARSMEEMGQAFLRISLPSIDVDDHLASFMLYDETWRSIDPADWWRRHCTPTPDIEFGPQHWHHELAAKLQTPMQFSRPFPAVRTPLEMAVLNRWNLLTAPDFPIPASPGYDFSHLNDDQPHGPAARRNAMDVPLPDHPARKRHRRRGRSRQ